MIIKSPPSKASKACCALLIGALASTLGTFAKAEYLDDPRFGYAQTTEKQSDTSYNAYILGPGDQLSIEILDVAELSGNFSIGPDGSIYLPRIRSLYVEGLTIDELQQLLTDKYTAYVKTPDIYIRPVSYRPIRVYVGGEVKRPGYYTLTGIQSVETSTQESVTDSLSTTLSSDSVNVTLFPTVFDAIRLAQGITPYSDLRSVRVIRKRAEGLGGGRKSTNLNFLSLITDGDESHNIRLFDGDVLNISKSTEVLREQLLKASLSNLSPQFVRVFVTGRVNTPGGITLPQGSSLNQAISLAGGAKILRGKIEFVRFLSGGDIDRRIFSYKPEAGLNDYNNPMLAAGDLIRIRDSIISSTVGVMNEITVPFIGLNSFFTLIQGN